MECVDLSPNELLCRTSSGAPYGLGYSFPRLSRHMVIAMYVIRCTGANESESFQRAQEWIAEVVRGALGRQQFLQAQLHAYNCVFQLMTDEQVVSPRSKIGNRIMQVCLLMIMQFVQSWNSHCMSHQVEEPFVLWMK